MGLRGILAAADHTADRRRALELLAASPDGCTEAIMPRARLHSRADG